MNVAMMMIEEFLLERDDRGAERDREQSAEGDREPGPHQILPTDRLSRHTERLLLADLRGQLLRTLLEQKLVGD